MDIQTLNTDYVGQRGRLFWLALKTSVLTVLSLGFYRFWMKTRLRRYYWSAIRPGGTPLEYTGTGVEKLMGFLIAVVVLAFYIGVFNLILMFLSFALLNDNFAAYAMSFVGIIPIYFYAQYRARRYVLARTRWRGLRFGIDPAAWAYAWRAMLHWLATFLTLGFLLPRQVFYLEKFRIDRTWFGGMRFHQGGRWTMLIRPALHYYAGIAISLTAVGLGMIEESFFLLLLLGLPWVAFGWVRFRVGGFRVLANHKRLGEAIGFRATIRTGRVLGIYIFGYLLAGLLLLAGLFGILIAFAIAAAFIGPELSGNAPLGANIHVTRLLETSGYLVAALAYFSFFIFWGVLLQIFVTFPLMKHYATSLVLTNGHHLSTIQQRPRDAFSEAEGFAEALDIGAAI